MLHGDGCQGFVVNFYLAINPLKTICYDNNHSKSFNFHMKKIALPREFQFTTYCGMR